MKETRKMTQAALFLALGLLLPFVTAQVPYLGTMLLPMHLPVILCALVCGWKWGFLIGLVTPILRSLLFGMPPMFPMAVSMAAELALNALAVAIVYKSLPGNRLVATEFALLAGIIAGRFAWMFAMVACTGVYGSGVLLASALLDTLPGTFMQFILVPLCLNLLPMEGGVRGTAKNNIR